MNMSHKPYFIQPFIQPPMKYHIKRNAISSITPFNIRQEFFNLKPKEGADKHNSIVDESKHYELSNFSLLDFKFATVWHTNY